MENKDYTEPVKTLSAFERPPQNPDSEVIQYPDLPAYADESRNKEKSIWKEFWAEEEGSLSEEDRAVALARGYLVLTAEQMHNVYGKYSPHKEKQQISRRFTEASIELYGQPDPEEVRRQAAAQYNQFAAMRAMPGVDQTRLERVLGFLREELGQEPSTHAEEEASHEAALSAFRESFLKRFGQALELFDGIEKRQSVSVEEVKELFEQAIEVLAEKEPAWRNWSVGFKEGKKSMSSDSRTRQIIIGRDGKYSPGRVRRLFIEEGLVHSLRAINGAKTGDQMIEHGLPGYLSGEEGLAKFIQVAMGDELGDRAVDLYIDTAFALGQLGQPQISRPELQKFFEDKYIVRKQAKGEEIASEEVKDTTWRYVNRIYRGSLGNEYIAVNTKDISYYHGFLLITQYVEEQLAAGVKPEDILDYLLSGRFDPTSDRHNQYAKDKLAQIGANP